MKKERKEKTKFVTVKYTEFYTLTAILHIYVTLLCIIIRAPRHWRTSFTRFAFCLLFYSYCNFDGCKQKLYCSVRIALHREQQISIVKTVPICWMHINLVILHGWNIFHYHCAIFRNFQFNHWDWYRVNNSNSIPNFTEFR